MGAGGDLPLLLALAALAAAESVAWAAVGVPELGGLAAAQAGLDLATCLVVSDPGPRAAQVLAVLLESVPVVLVGASVLPAARVAERLGPEGIGAHRVARGGPARPVSVRTAGQDHTAQRLFEVAEEQADSIVFVALALADELHERLAAAGVVCARLEAVVETADGRTLTRIFRHEGRLSSRAVAERVRGVLAAWSRSTCWVSACCPPSTPPGWT